jgi:hypothetical protein
MLDIQVKVGDEWKYQPRLVSWYGPCDYSYSSKYSSLLNIQVKLGGEWKYQPRLVSWYGPCDYSYSG